MAEQTAQTAHWPVIGHGWAVAQLQRAIRYDRMRHAYLFTGPRQIGKTTLARAFAAALNCTGPVPPCGDCRACTLTFRDAHPDVQLIQAEQEGGQIKIEQLRDLQQMLALRPYEARYRVVILRRFDAARPIAQDALLKTLEEPAPRVVLILTADSTAPLLSTILSRCQPMKLRPLPIALVHEALEEHYGAAPEQARMLAQLSGGRIGWAIRVLREPALLEQRHAALDALEAVLHDTRRGRFALAERLSNDKASLGDTLETWRTFWRDVLLVAAGSRAPITNYDRREAVNRLAAHTGVPGARQALQVTRRTQEALEKNANVRLALEVLLLDYPGL